MPVIYRPRPQQFEHSNQVQQRSIPVPTDADDSIVLSDLVRQGEASRLRRRGAMRLDHGPMGAQPTVLTQEPSDNPSATVIGSPTSESEPEPEPDDGPVFARNSNVDRERGYRSGYGYGSGRGRSRGDVSEDSDDLAYTLFCGGDDSDTEMDVDIHQGSWQAKPFEPSILPLYPPTPYTHASSSTKRPLKSSSGCGALLHMNASPRRRLGVFTAKNEASTGAVIGLDSTYFDRAAVAKIVRSACGCVREGIGCAVCGKPLGTRYKPCKTATEGVFTSRSNSRPNVTGSLYPEGSRYWHAQSHTRSYSSSATSSHASQHDQAASSLSANNPSSPFYVYTFFSTSVSSSPAYTFPPRHPPAHAPSESQTQPQPLRSQYQPLPQQPQPLPPYQSQYRPRPYPFQQRPQAAQSSRQLSSPFPRLRSAADQVVNVFENESDNDENDDTSSVPQINVTGDGQSERPATPGFIAENAAPTASITLFDRVLTASPTSLSEAGDGLPAGAETQEQSRRDGGREEIYTQYQYQADPVEEDGYRELGYRYGPVFDPDGEFVAEPDSPDKTGDVMLLPER